MKLVLISDSHEQHQKLTLPEGDVLIHAGDASFRGDVQAMTNFVEWMKEQPFKHKIFIAGNHELSLDPDFSTNGFLRPVILNILKENNIIYLENSWVVIDGVKYYGCPQTRRFHSWAFNVDPDKIHKYWDMIPNDTNVLITHQPNFGILDSTIDNGNQGCPALLRRIKQLKQLKLHVCGHLHMDGSSLLEEDGATFVNAAVLNDNYKLHNKPIITFDI